MGKVGVRVKFDLRDAIRSIMTIHLRFGADRSVPLDVPAEALLALGGTPAEKPVGDLQAELRARLDQPVEYPSLAESTTPGDRVVVVLDAGLPRGGELAAGVVEYLVEAGVQPDGVTVLESAADRESGWEDPRARMPCRWRDEIRLVTHDPTARSKLAYLASTASGHAVFLNRALVDADMVIPVGSSRAPGAPEYYGVLGTLYPQFAELDAMARFRSPRSLNAAGQLHRNLAETVAEVGWLLGTMFALQVVPGGGDQVLHLLAGQIGAIEPVGQQLHHRAWASIVPRTASLVVVGIEGGPRQQTWQNLARSLAVALPLVEEGGAIALCTELAVPPGPGIRRLAKAHSREDGLRTIERRRPADLLLAELLARAQEQATVFLLSQLAPSLLEQLEVAAIRDGEELERLVQRHPSCIVLSNGPYVEATLEAAG